jgi:2,3-dihydroxybenzoate decarboxylase
MRELKFCGAMINGHTNGQYLDHLALHPFWERAEALGALIYLHPVDPISPAPVLDGYKGLRRATWEWTFETGSHALRLIFGGLFDRFPRARVGLGHLGETLPFLLWRFDSRAGPNFYAIKLGKPPSQYFKDNFIVTTSGMCSAESLNCTIAALGHERVMFAADYPFESAQEAGAFMDEVAIAEPVRRAIAADTAAKYLRLSQPAA